MAEIMRFTVSEQYDGVNAGRYLRTVCKLSARTLALLKRTQGGILRDGMLLRSVDKVYTGDVIEINLPSEEINITPVMGDLDIIFEDEYILIVNKPANMPVHPVKVHQEDTLANIIAYNYSMQGEEFVFRAVNRLDRDTSGAVIIAKDRHTASMLQNTPIDKRYIAVCHGVTDAENTIDAPIDLAPDSKIVRCVCDSGKSAVTHYKRLSRFSDASVLDLWLETGRTHQIRCHMSYLGHPLYGDDLYGGSREYISRQALHCRKVSFLHPVTNEEINVCAQLPEDISALISFLSGGDTDENKTKE